MSWPPITEPLLLERLGMDDTAFLAFIAQTFAALPPRRLTAAGMATALDYPWERPERSYVLTAETVALLDELEPARREALLAARALGPDAAPRYPLLAIGSNGAPATLARKLAHLPRAQRRVLVLAGELHGFDVGAAAHPTAYGAMAATLFESPGTAVRAAVLWVSAAQLTQLSWTEITYRLGRLDGVAFVPDQGSELIDGVLAYSSRWGVFCPGGEPAALAAVPAAGRSARALTQEQVLDHAARLGLGRGATAESLVRTIFKGDGALGAEGSARIRACGRPFAAAAWAPWPSAGGQRS